MLTVSALADVPALISYQGLLADAGGVPVADGSYSVTFTIYDAASGGNTQWTGTQNIMTSNGRFDVLLGSLNPIVDTVFNGTTRYLGLTVGGDPEMSPRIALVSVPFTFHSAKADSSQTSKRADFADSADAITDGAVDFADIGINGALSGQVMKFDGIEWTAASDNTGGAGVWVDDGTVVRLDTNTDSVGIGTSTPSEKLEVSGNVLIAGKATIGSGHTNSGLNSFVAGASNTVSGDSATIGGGANNTASGRLTTIGGGAKNTADVSLSTVCGGLGNTAGNFAATVSGGLNNMASDFYATVGGGNNNISDTAYSTIGGGNSNISNGYASTIGGGVLNSTAGWAATIGGGQENIADSDYTTVGGGFGNNAIGQHSFVGGGLDNSIFGQRSTISGGSADTITAWHSTISGGRKNRISSDYSTIGGGSNNVVHFGSSSTIGGGAYNTVSGVLSTIAGGKSNTIITGWSTIGGGVGNTVSGLTSTVPGGFHNEAHGSHSFAAGSEARAYHDGSFVWADSKTGVFQSSASNQFNVRASGGTRIFSDSTLTTGVVLVAGGGSWAAVSDSTVKKNMRSVNGEEILERLSQLDITRWNYKTQDASVEHIGPMAQDFYRLFRVGDNNTTITTIDPDGIALAAIKELTKKNDRLEAELKELRELIEQLTENGN